MKIPLMNKLSVNQVVYLKPINNAARREHVKIISATISKVGKTYFTLEQAGYGRFDMNTMLQDGKGYSANYKAYISMEEIENEKECERLISSIRDKIGHWGTPSYSLEILRAVNELLAND